MISDNEFTAMIAKLLHKTSREHVAWQQKKPAKDIFQLKLPRSIIELEFVSPTAEPDSLTFSLLRASDSQSVAQRKVYEGEEFWNQLFDLYALVRRQVLGWDEVMKDVQQFLGKSDVQSVS